MIRFDFNYKRPESIEQALSMMQESRNEGLKAVYYGGGTELLTLFRKGKSSADLVIDIKEIKELNTLECVENTYTLGAALNLNDVIEKVAIPPLKEVLEKIADHTTRNALTLGGNMCGKLPYKEAVLPLLMLNATVVIATTQGIIEKPLSEVFDKRMTLEATDLLLQIKVTYDGQSYFTQRHTESVEVDYPILHLVSMTSDQEWFIALSGYGSCPIYKRFKRCDTQSIKETIHDFMDSFSELAKTCPRASASYKKHVLTCAFEDMFKVIGGGEVSEID